MLATWITNQLVFDGVVNGLVYGMLALGIVLVYRSTRVINFAVGNIGLVGGALFALVVVNYKFPFWIGVVVALAVGALFGAVIELTVVRRLFESPRVTLLVATVGVAQLALAIIASYPEVERQAKYPVISSTVWRDLRGVDVTAPELTILVVVPLVAALLGWLLHRTTFGKAVAASADNRPLARLSGVNPKRVSTFVWVVAGVLSTLAIMLLSGRSGSVTGISSLGPLTLARAMVAATIAGMRSFPRAIAAGVLIGVLEAVLRFNVFDEPGLVDFVLLVLVVIAVYVQRVGLGADERGFSFVPKTRPVPEHVRRHPLVRSMAPVALGLMLIAAVVLPLLVTAPSRHLLYATILCFAICASSLTVITGWAGELSLSQMTFAGLGALTAAALQRGVEVDLFGLTAQVPRLPFVVSILVATLLIGLVAAAVGLGALRVRGLLLGVVTFVFALAAQQYIYRRPVFSDGRSTSVPFRRGDLLGLDLASNRTYYYLCLVVMVLVLVSLSRLRRSGVGRRTIAVRDNAETAAAYTVSPLRTRLTAFALSGSIASLGGSLLAGVVQSVPFGERFFLVGDSLRVVGMVVIGGIASVVGPLLGALWVVGLPAFFPGNEVVPLFTSSVGLLLVVMYFPGGFAQIASSARGVVVRWVERRHPADTTKRAAAVASGNAVVMRPATQVVGGAPVLRVGGLTVTFRNLRAVNEVDLEVGRDEIVGLIGTNGAGKSTLMNAISGLVPATGRIELLGNDVSSRAASRRAHAGLGRTFQSARLFPELTVRETVMVALEARGRTGLPTSLVGWPTAVAGERRKRAEADDLIDFLGLGRYADSHISELSTGTRRIVELAGLLALDARLLCLDEPTAGVAQRESEAFGPLLKGITREMGASMLIVEHDMPLVLGLSDRVYCLELGAVIASGSPKDVRNNPVVIASYLGTDSRAIDRSDAAPPEPIIDSSRPLDSTSVG